MNIILVIGLLTLSQSLCGHRTHDLSVSSTNSREVVTFLCDFLPNIFKSKCKFNQNNVEKKVEEKDFFNPKISLKSDSNAKTSVNSIESVIENVISIVVTENLLQKVNPLCSFLPFPLNDSCTTIISLESKEDFDNILQLVNWKELNENLEVLYQKKLHSFQWYNLSQEHGGVPIACYMCKLIVKELGYLLNHNTSREMIVKVLSTICKLFKGERKEKCQKFISKYWNKLIDYLVQRVSSDKLCRLLMLCSNNLKEEDMKIVEDILLDEKEALHDSTDNREIYDNKEDEIRQEGANPVECLLCTKVMEGIIDGNENKKSKVQIENALKNSCYVLPKSLIAECENLVNQHRETIVKVIMDNVSPSKICSLLYSCSTNV